tara:strand:- start:10492 stop:13722 length:3231 start_codon:yes stop_codon:yes gene_type:complete
MTTNDFTLGTPTSVTSLGTGSSDSTTKGFLSFDPTAQRIVLLRGGGGTATSRWAVFSNDGTDFTQQSTGIWDSSTNNFAQRGGILQTAMTTNMTSNPIPIVMNNGNTGYGYSAVFTVGQSEVSNLDNNYFGIASSSASDTEAVGVNRPGSINIDQTGLTAGKDYYAKGDGTIIERTTTTNTTNNDPTVAFTTMNDAHTVSSDGEAQMVYDSTSETFVVSYENGVGSDYPTVVAGTWSNGTMTWGTPVVLQSVGCNREIGIAVGNGKVWTAWARNVDTPNIYITSLSISGTAITVATPTDTSIAYSNELGIKLSYDISSDYLLLFNSNQSTGSWLFKVKPYYTTSSGGLTAGTTSTIVTNGSIHHNEFDVVYDPDTSRTVVVYTDDSNSNYGTANVIQSSGTSGSPTVTIGSDVVFSGTDAVNGLTATYDTANDKVFVGYHNTTDGITKGIIGSVTGGGTNSISFAGEGTINDYTAVSSSYLDIVYDADVSKIFAVYRDDDHTSDGLTYKIITPSASSFTVSSASVITTNDNQLQSGAGAYGQNKGVVVASRDVDNSSKLSISTLYYATTSSTTVNASQFVGTARSSTDLELAEPPIELVGTADGSITKGDAVIISTDGDFQKIGNVTTSLSYSAGTETEIDTDQIYQNTISYNSENNYFVVFYSETNASYYGYARSFQVTDKVISNNQSLGAFHTNTTKILDSAYIGGSKHIVFYIDENNYLNARVVLIGSDGTGTYGTENTINSGTTQRRGSCYYDSDKDVVVVIAGMDSDTCKAIACTVSGTTITAGTKQAVPSSDSQVYDTSSSYDVENNIGLVAWDDGNNGKLNCATISLSGTGNRTITFNSVLEIKSATNIITKGSLTYDPVSKKHLLAYTYSPYSYVYGVVLTVSGTSVTKGTEASIYSGFDSNWALQGSDQGGISIYYRDPSSPNYLKGAVATISGTDFSLSNEATLNAEQLKSGVFGDCAFRSSDYMTIVCYVTEANDYLEAIVTIPNGSILAPNLTATNFIGFAQETVADNEDVKVATTGQTDSNQSSLTSGTQLYVQGDGTLSTTAGTPSVLGGTALSSTKILIKS